MIYAFERCHQSCVFQNAGLSEGQFLDTVFDSRIFSGAEASFLSACGGFPRGEEGSEKDKRLGDAVLPWRKEVAAPGCRVLPQGRSVSHGRPQQGPEE